MCVHFVGLDIFTFVPKDLQNICLCQVYFVSVLVLFGFVLCVCVYVRMCVWLVDVCANVSTVSELQHIFIDRVLFLWL